MKLKKLLPILLLGVFMILSILNPKTMIDAASDSLQLWAVRVVPSLFPFLFASRALLLLGADKPITVLLSPVLRLMGFPQNGSYPFLVSLLCGYPSGAKVLGDMVRDGTMSPAEAGQLAPLCHTSGPVFVLGTAATLVGTSRGGLLLLCHIAAVLCSSCIFNIYHAPPQPGKKVPVVSRDLPMGQVLMDACSSATSAMLTVGGFVVFFGCICAFIEMYTPLGWVAGLLEMTNGLARTSGASTPHLALPLACLQLSFSGLCINAQALAFLPKESKPMKFIGCKILCGILSFMLCCTALLGSVLLCIACTGAIVFFSLLLRRVIWKTVPSSWSPVRRFWQGSSPALPKHHSRKPLRQAESPSRSSSHH